MSRIIAIGNQKGGVGKTTTTYNLATAMAMRGYTVCMIDNDSQGSLTSACGYYMDMDLFENISTINLFRRNTDPADCCFSVDALGKLSSKLYLVPSCERMAVWAREIYEYKDALPTYASNVRSLAEDFDYIFIDCPPDLGALLLCALLAADEVVIPVQTTYDSYAKLPYLISTINQVKGYSAKKALNTNPNLAIAGVIASIHRANVKEHKDILNELDSNYTLLGIVNEAAVVTKFRPQGLPVVYASKSSVPAKQFQSIADKLLFM